MKRYIYVKIYSHVYQPAQVDPIADDMEAALAAYEEAKTALSQFIGPDEEYATLKARRDTVHPSVPAVCVRAKCR